MFIRNVIEPTEKTELGVEVKTQEYYRGRKREKLAPIGPLIKGIDVGVARYADLHLDYPTYDLTTSEIVYSDFDFGGFRVRWFHQAQLQQDKALTVFFIHGGGFMTGTLERYVHLDKRVCELIDGNLFHIDYTLSPETGYPTALEQCYFAIKTIVENAEKYHVDPEKVAIMGDSAGGNLCAALPFRDKETRYIKYNILYYPLVDFTDYSNQKFDLSFYGENLDPFVIERINNLRGNKGLNKIYLQNQEDPTDELISPLLAKDFSGYPATLVLSAHYDFLSLQALEFAEKIDAAGSLVEYYLFAGTFHGFADRVGYFESADCSFRLVAEKLKQYFR